MASPEELVDGCLLLRSEGFLVIFHVTGQFNLGGRRTHHLSITMAYRAKLSNVFFCCCRSFIFHCVMCFVLCVCVRVCVCFFLQKFLSAAGDAAQDKPVVVSKFILNAKEIEFDGVAQDGKILNYAISEHVEV